MENYKIEFIEFLVRAQVLTFGDFTTKSGRATPYFINTGRYRTGAQISALGWFYAAALERDAADTFDNLYGPAYKGIPLVVTTAIALHHAGRGYITFTFNRKEAKTHGEQGVLIGHPYDGSERIMIVEDVITAGTSVRDTLDLLRHHGSPAVTGVIVSVDRMERGTGDLSALQELRQTHNIPCYAIVTVREVIEVLHNKPVDGQIYIDDERQEKMQQYLAEYGPR